jgi:hypothetical protein
VRKDRDRRNHIETLEIDWLRCGEVVPALASCHLSLIRSGV